LSVGALSNARAWLARLPLVGPLAMFASSGIAFAAANIIWARTLPVDAYAIVALCVAIQNLAQRFAPFGADLQVNRGAGALSGHGVRRVVATSLLVAVSAALAAGIGYRLHGALAVSLAVATFAGGVTVYAAASLQARRRFLPSLALLHSGNYLLLALSIVTAATGVADASVIVGAIAVGAVIVLVAAAFTLRRLLNESTGTALPYAARTLLPLVAIAGSAEIMTQLDRLMTPLLLNLADLARLSVLLALIGPPFRLIEMAVAYAMLPELRAAAATPGAPWRALRGPVVMALAVSGTAAVLLLAFIGPVSQWLTDARYVLPLSLVVVALVAGLVRVAHGFSSAATTALIPNESLLRMSALGLLSVAVAIVGAVIGSRWGLEGVICGSMTGWLFRVLGSLKLLNDAVRHRSGTSA
jgi:O-antigen/teichoic acid export membrane protein